MEPYSIRCTTCRAKLKVRDESAIGQILNCPKCGSMIEIVPPKDWPRDTQSDSQVSDASAATERSSQPKKKSSWSLTPPDFDDIPTDADRGQKKPLRETDSHTYSSITQKTKSPVSDATPEATSQTEGERSAEGGEAHTKAHGQSQTPPPMGSVPQPPDVGRCAAEAATQEDMQRDDDPPIPSSPAWAVLAERIGHRRLMIGLVALAIGLLVVIVISQTQHQQSNENEPVAKVAEVADEREPIETDDVPPPVGESDRAEFDSRWVPDGARFVMSLRLAELSREPGFQAFVDHIDPLWRQLIGPVIEPLEITESSIERITLSAAGPLGWPVEAVVVLRLNEPLSEAQRSPDDFVELDWKCAGVPCYRSASGGWPHPIAFPDERTVVSGPRELLEPLGQRTIAKWESSAVAELMARIDASRQAFVIVDTSAVPASESDPTPGPAVDWDMPIDLVTSIFASASEQEEWRAMRDEAIGLGVSVDFEAHRLDIESALVATDAQTAVQMGDTLERMLATLADQLKTGPIEPPSQTESGSRWAGTSEVWKRLHEAAGQGVENRHITTEETVLWVRTQIEAAPEEIIVAAAESMPRLQAARTAAGNRSNETRRTRLLGSLTDYADLEDGFPQGAAGAVQLAPTSRLSWIASLLPFLDRGQWHRELNFRRSWNDTRNQEVTRRPLEFVVNPLVRPKVTDDGFPVTHYVGAGGVGPDAGTLPLDHPRAGVFGYNRRVRAEMIGDGASQTIALLPVQGSLGPWSSGGAATVRSLTTRPYINGPDGFGDGQPDGMLVAMADGSVAFISSGVDSEVLERLVTINGQDPVDLSIFEQRASPDDPVADERLLDRPAEGEVANDAVPKDENDPANMEEGPGEPIVPAPEPVVFSEQAIAERLAHELNEVDFRGVSLADFVDFLAQMTELTFAFDLDALAAAGVTPEAPVNVHRQKVDVETALTVALAEHALTYEITDGLLLITRPRQQREKLAAVKYETAGLAGADDEQTERLARLIRTVVAPTTWRDPGGRGFVEVSGDRLTVHQTEAVHHQVADLFTRLRVARRAAGDDDVGQASPPGTRRRRAQAKLLTPVTAHFPEPTPLASILRYVSEQTDTLLVIDALALRQAGRVVRIESTLNVNRTSLAQTLDQLCETLDLTYRVRDDRTIEITTHSAAAGRPELEFFFVGDLVGDKIEREALIAEIKGRVAPEGWGDEPSSGVLYFDEPSGCLLVWQPQRVQTELERLLESKHAPAPAPTESE